VARPEAQRPAAATGRDERRNAKQARARQADATRPLRVELQAIDARLARLAAEKLEVEALLAQPAAAADAYAELGRRLAHVSAETSQLEERWLELHAALESPS
jgi:ATP-binding cassette subfamily F protein 3